MTTFLRLLLKNDAPLTKIDTTKNGYNALTDDQQNIDKMLTPKAIKLFQKINLSPSTPPELRSKRTVFVRQLDRTIGSRPPAEILHEIESNNQWLKINKVAKIKEYTHIIKIELTDCSMTEQILNNGFFMFNTKVSPHQCEQEKFTHILICYNCYQMEDHISEKCPNKNKIVCSEYGQQGHKHTDCTNETKKCLNCGQGHRTLWASCPYRKDKTTKKETELTNKKTKTINQTYAHLAKTLTYA